MNRTKEQGHTIGQHDYWYAFSLCRILCSTRLNLAYRLLQYVIIYLTVAVKCPAAFNVSAHLANNIWVAHGFVGCTYESPASHVRAGNITNAFHFRFTSSRIAHRDYSCYSTYQEYSFYRIVVFLWTYKRKQSGPRGIVRGGQMPLPNQRQ